MALMITDTGCGIGQGLPCPAARARGLPAEGVFVVAKGAVWP